jgi:hypothetical protein
MEAGPFKTQRGENHLRGPWRLNHSIISTTLYKTMTVVRSLILVLESLVPGNASSGATDLSHQSQCYSVLPSPLKICKTIFPLHSFVCWFVQSTNSQSSLCKLIKY